MKTMYHIGIAITVSMLLVSAGLTAGEVGAGKSYKGPTGLQLYSLRNMFKNDGVPATLDKVKEFGFKYVELAGTYGMSPVDFKAELDKRDLVPVCGHFSFNLLRDDIGKVAEEAKALGLKYVGCAWIPHKKPFDEKQCLETAAVFNKAGKALAKQGMKFYYHNHGYEFYDYKQGTLFDLLVTETNPKFVSFQMDVLWTVFPAQDPAALLAKYPDRWLLVHLKDLKKGAETGSLAGHTELTNDVALGTGQVDWPAFFKASQEIGVKYYFIEDESPTVIDQIPQSLRFLENLEF